MSGSNVRVRQRVSIQHPEIMDTDVLTAWDNCVRTGTRSKGAFNQTVAIGFDGKGRLLEMVAVLEANGTWQVFHAMAPPSKKTLKELGLGDERSKR